MAIIVMLVFFAAFWVSLVYTEGVMQLAFSIITLVSMVLSGFWGILNWHWE